MKSVAVFIAVQLGTEKVIGLNIKNEGYRTVVIAIAKCVVYCCHVLNLIETKNK